MLSGIVTFEEIVDEVKELTGYENMRPLYDRIRKAIFRAETDIGAGGLIIRKKKNYITGDGFYDGTTVLMPEDFIGEYSYAALTQGVLNGNVMTLNCPPGPTEITMRYMGWLLDDKGNPFTTRNHMEAVISCCIMRLYSSRYFLGKGNRNQYKDYKQDYNDDVMGARGSDSFPTEAQWEEIGSILNGGVFEAFADCGLISCGEDNTLTDGGIVTPVIVATYPCTLIDIFNAAMIDQPPEGFLPSFSGLITASSIVTGRIKPKFDGMIDANSVVTGIIIDQP